MRNIIIIGLLGFMLGGSIELVSAHSNIKSAPSIEFVEQLGHGWNLGNAFDSYDLVADNDEMTWGNPKVTKQLLHEVRAQGFESIRIPLTLIYRMNADNKIDEAYLKRYEEVVQWALDADLFVLINLHHDSKEWLMKWDGETSSEEYKKFTAIWEQLAERFKDYDQRLFFESINEPYFELAEGESDVIQFERLAALNQAFHRIVRESGRLNETRMLVLPTILSQFDQPKLDALAAEITQLKDPNLLASIHYYGEWEFSNNIGVVSFDEPIRNGVSQRQAMEDLIKRLEQTFTNNQIGILIGEYGLLGYDRHPQVNNQGETQKFITYFNQLTRDKPMALMIWDNGQHFNRETFTWQPSQFGDAIVQSMTADSAYALYGDSTFLKTFEDGIFVELVYNGASISRVLFNGEKLTADTDYTVNEKGIYVTPEYLKNHFANVLPLSGKLATLTFHFNQGASWNQQVYWIDELSLKPSVGNTGEDLVIGAEFAGHLILRGALSNAQGDYITQNEGWPYLTFMEELIPDSEAGQLILPATLTAMLEDGDYELLLDTYAGTSYQYRIHVEDGLIEGWHQR